MQRNQEGEPEVWGGTDSGSAAEAKGQGRGTPARTVGAGLRLGLDL